MARAAKTPTVRERRPEVRAQRAARERSPLRRALAVLGPGFVTGASDDDPSGIGTYATAGASLGLATLWTALLTFPFMAAVQLVCARLGLVTGRGLAGILKRHYPAWIVAPAVLLLVVANTVNIGADLAAMVDAVHILTGFEVPWLVVPVAIGILVAQVFASYRVLARLFKWLTLTLFAYVVDAVVIGGDLGAILRATIVPTISGDPRFIATLVAIVGTTISPYLFFWQTSNEVEEEKAAGRASLRQRRGATRIELRHSTIDVTAGMAFSNLVMYFIILATGLTLFPSGQTDIATGADAAGALRPLAGDVAGMLFALGMLGTGMLAVPILSGSAAYAVSELFGWRASIDEKWWRAKGFYAVIVGATLVGAALDFIGIAPMDALFGAALINGAAAPFLLVLIMRAASDPKVMGRHKVGGALRVLGWSVAVVMFVALAGLGYATVAS